MKTRFINLWHAVSSSYWFIPTIMVVSSILFSFVTIYIDKNVLKEGWLEHFSWFFSTDPNGARAFLSTVAGSMITVAGVVFSVSIVALTLAAGQFGPRILINFMRDTGNQIVLGTFIATFVYCLIVLRTIEGGNDNAFIPNLSISFAGILAVLSIGVLIYFIHHAASSIHVSNLLTHISRDLENTIERLCPLNHDNKILQKDKKWWQASKEITDHVNSEKHPIRSTESGYIQAIDYEGVFNLATHNNLAIDVKSKPGDFIIKDQVVAEVFCMNNLGNSNNNIIMNHFILGENRTNEQDIRFVIDQLVEIAVKALSPGVNDPFTAIMCIDRLVSALCLLADRSLPATSIYDEQNCLRLILERDSFVTLVDSAFTNIRYYLGSNISVSKRMLEGLYVLMQRVNNHRDRKVILQHAKLVREFYEHNSTMQSDFDDIDAICSKIEAMT
ncbi:MAG: DUF2254 domain-containing protein [Candidatus Dadabacteria bacterium]|nr:DUF2254 domain-containing protein [Candidatus Dadabacteria bacterium]NIS07681.1 DUF2254 domain-containing protein [Candidatus Dadabacteria bacterium]NIV42260.1 DUF2254 domain-containing protein [Candidatus Dadabacteria bacterium]NIX14767.1 DUF2254 domain-containing protein [Candidatus Dadabacteria bacterium]NIY21308.1 DUF2254 domain-containing protein [Candidatus Dadabacteria bacterium]